MTTQAQPQVKLGDILRVYNDGDRLFRNMWDLVDYVIPPGGEDVLPFEAVICFFGDPRSGKSVARASDRFGQTIYINDRQTEVRRLRLMYGPHGFGDYTGQEGPEMVWEQDKIPHVRVETLKGERVWTVIDDPAGRSVAPAIATVAESDSLRETVAEQGKIIHALMQKMGVSELPDVSPRNIYNPANDEIEPARLDDPLADPEIFDDLPEDR